MGLRQTTTSTHNVKGSREIVIALALNWPGPSLDTLPLDQRSDLLGERDQYSFPIGGRQIG
jgi:hypothetical protein